MSDDESLAAAYEFELPPELIAQEHAHPRDSSRLLVVTPGGFKDEVFRDLDRFMLPGDVLVINETRVIAARIFGERAGSGGRVELLLLHPAAGLKYDASALRWTTLMKPARKMVVGARVVFGSLGHATVVGVQPDGMREVEFDLGVPFETFLDSAGRLPLPPYIRNESQTAQDDYQTIFARVPGSVAAPTASLHFTPVVMESLRHRGVEIVPLCLDVGLGTFRPMKTERLQEHVMHAEAYDIPAATAARIALARQEGRRVIAAGTTVLRALEGSARKHGFVRAGADETDIFITPGFKFGVVDALITNFHLPRSTLLVLVSAFTGRERMLEAYAHAVREGYRFFSFGDAMFLPRG